MLTNNIVQGSMLKLMDEPYKNKALINFTWSVHFSGCYYSKGNGSANNGVLDTYKKITIKIHVYKTKKSFIVSSDNQH